jgi:hypothetical protein
VRLDQRHSASCRHHISKLNPAKTAWLTIWRQKYGLTADEICKKLRKNAGEDIDPASVEEYLQSRGLPLVSESTESELQEVAQPISQPQFSSAMERDVELALLPQLDSLGLKLFMDENGRSGRQYPCRFSFMMALFAFHGGTNRSA